MERNSGTGMSLLPPEAGETTDSSKTRSTMYTTRECDLEEIPLDDDDSSSIEFQILAFYAKHHVFKSTPAVFSPKLLRIRSLSQKGLECLSANDPLTLGLRACRSSRSSEKPIPKKKPSWRTIFGGGEKEDSTEIHAHGSQTPLEYQGAFHNQQWARSLSNVERCREAEAVNPKVVSIANRVAEIVHSWPLPEESHTQGGSSKHTSTPRVVLQGGISFQAQGPQPRGASPEKDGEDQIIHKIVELLKYSGDHLEREMRKDKALMSIFQDSRLPYSLFKIITDQFLRGVDTRGESEVKAKGFKAALAIDVAAKLTIIDNHPMNRMLGFGTKYLKENFSPWVQQHGGWEKVLGTSHEETEH
ncbi:apoptosis facilitator Bcl-2-like protein 14 [Elephas maximus indicus]|uniref:apoptosis facilitator Bcl-2-like protein 14 n=1 Tax=Elephas maximus indicus TaxID=99487 RepID=UPI00211719DC|nr:apoptosis facilitator Bcl-2-like protein 14 [Elephas maximus indicus]